MAKEIYRFFDTTIEDPRIYQADDWADQYRELFSDGIKNGGSNLRVEVGSGLQVVINPGFALIQGYMYRLESETGKEKLALTLGPADAAKPRIDRIVLRLSTAQQNRYIRAFVLPGTPADSPVPPTLTRNANTWEMSLAYVRVSAMAVSLSAIDVTDERYHAEACGLINGLVTLDGTEFERRAEEILDNLPDLDTRQEKISVVGLLKGAGSGTVGAAVAGTDYAAPAPKSSALLKGDGSGGMAAAVAGTDYATLSQVESVEQTAEGKQDEITVSGILKGAGNGSVVKAVAGTDYVQPSAMTAALAAKQKKITYGTSAPSGGADGDVYIQY